MMPSLFCLKAIKKSDQKNFTEIKGQPHGGETGRGAKGNLFTQCGGSALPVLQAAHLLIPSLRDRASLRNQYPTS